MYLCYSSYCHLDSLPKVLQEIKSSSDLDNPDNSSMAFTIPLSHVVGLDIDELHKFEDDVSSLL